MPFSHLLLHFLNHGSPNAVFEVELLERVPLLPAAVPPDRADVQHAHAELDERTPLDGDVYLMDKEAKGNTEATQR